MIECTVNGHKYETSPLYFEDFTTLGFMTEEKVYPFFNLSDSVHSKQPFRCGTFKGTLRQLQGYF